MFLFVVLLFSAFSMHAKTLVAYYSYTNNVEKIVNELRTQIKCDILEIEPAVKGLDYAANNYALGTQLLNTIKANPMDASSYPAIDRVEVDLTQYSTVIIACPLWWSQMAAPFQPFLFQFGSQMAGKNIGLIVSSASSGISGVEADAKRLVPNGRFLKPNLWIRSSQTSNAGSMIEQWLKDINYSALTAGIGDIAPDNRVAVSIYDMQGALVAENLSQLQSLRKGVYVINANGKSTKVVL